MSGLLHHYLNRSPERLVVEGYRCLLSQAVDEKTLPVESAWLLYAGLLGPEGGRWALGELSRFLTSLQLCAQCPLRTSPARTDGMSREECLVLALLASLQHGDEIGHRCSAEALVCPLKATEFTEAAGSFAMTLKALRQLLLPFPHALIDRLASPDAMTTGARPAMRLH
ncbi:MAG: hypothetical protein H6883_05760 [Rhodobiaceae bacterium]|nr:hypothetical protein [Rhodobiaceae bacterium]MCC0055623.1 hypothetical protein [Rhodobiaceae bacterium]